MSVLAKQENEFIQNYVENLVENELDINFTDYTSIDLKKFNNLEYFIKSKVILKLIQKVLGSTQGIEKIHIDDIIKLCSKNIGNKYLTPNKNVKVLVKSGRIYFIKLPQKNA